MDRWIGGSLDRWVCRSTDRWIVICLIDRSGDWWIGRSMDRLIGRLDWIGRWMDGWMDW